MIVYRFFSFCNHRGSSSSSSCSSSSSSGSRSIGSSRIKAPSSSARSTASKFALQHQRYHQLLLHQHKNQSSNVFGFDLTEHTRRFSDHDSIPYIVKSCTRFIEKHGIIFGIYRLSGMRINIHKLRQDFDKNPKISMIDIEAISNDAHAVACVLKQYFRELPTPLLTFHMYEKFIELFKSNIKSSPSTTSTKTAKPTRLTPTLEEPLITTTTTTPIDAPKATTTRSPSPKQADKQVPTSTSNDGDDQNPATTSATPRQSINDPRSSPVLRILAEAIEAKAASPHLFKSKPTHNLTPSASDSQLISLSSVVTTTTSDVKYQVKLDELRRLLLQLPKAHYETLKFLMRHLACIAANGQKTGMDSKNVAIVWAPNLLKPRELELSAGLETLQIIGLQAVITEQLIKHHKFLFDDDSGEGRADEVMNWQ